MITQKQGKNTKRTFWTALVFYSLIVFEFFYMASPIAAYFYSAYRPGLNFLNSIPRIAWLSSFFLPHIVIETASPLINAHNIIGSILFTVGLLAFLTCASQVYYHKLARKAEVTGGLYRFIRHPQYAAFMLCGLGTLLMWPRFLVLVMFFTMTFVYYFLARIEEHECEEKFGQSYVEYKNRTGMFLPFDLLLADKLPSLPKAGSSRTLSILALYVVTLVATIGIGNGIKLWALNSLFAVYTPKAAYISVVEIKANTLEQIKEIALSDADIQAKLTAAGQDARFIAYILPTEWSVPEIPMNNSNGHRFPQNYNRSLYKVIFTEAQLPEGQYIEGNQILLKAVHKIGIVEVWVDLSTNQVIRILEIPKAVKYEGVPVPIY